MKKCRKYLQKNFKLSAALIAVYFIERKIDFIDIEKATV